MYTTRSGRVSKPPQRYEPKEQVIDDFEDDEGEDIEDSDDESDSDSSDEEDADEHGNLHGFVTYDDE